MEHLARQLRTEQDARRVAELAIENERKLRRQIEDKVDIEVRLRQEIENRVRDANEVAKQAETLSRGKPGERKNWTKSNRRTRSSGRTTRNATPASRWSSRRPKGC